MKSDSFVSLPGPAWLLKLTVLFLLLPAVVRSQEIVINEVLADNQSIAPLLDFPDYFPDYVELYNRSARDINLAAEGWSLSTKKNPVFAPFFNFKDFFYFPTGTVLPADSYLLVFFDDKTNFPGIHTTFTVGGTNVDFSLKRTGDDVLLFKGTSLVDSNFFGVQVPDLAVGRVPDGTGAFTLITPSPFGFTPSSGALDFQPNSPFTNFGNPLTLKINEWVATNSAGANKDWFEIYNPDTNIVVLSGLVFTDNHSNQVASLRPVVPLSYIAPLGFAQFFASDNDQDANEVKFSLSSSSGDEIWIFANNSLTGVIDHVFSTLIQKRDTSEGRVPDGGDTIITLPKPTPEDSNFGAITNAVFNEVLAHTDPPLEDAIELYNPTGSPFDLSNFWLSNNRDNPKKYRIPAGTIIAPHGYKVFYEYQFNPDFTGNSPSFTLNSANGDEVWLFSGNSAGKLTGFRTGLSFGPSANGVSFGRYVTSEGKSDFTAMSALSFGTSVTAQDPPSYLSIFRTGTGATNPYPRIGPIVINEIHYHPPDTIEGTNHVDDSINEFVELYNLTANPVPLYDPAIYRADRNYNPAPDGTSIRAGDIYADGRTNTWRLRGGISFSFPDDRLSLASGGFLLVVNFDPQTNLTQLAAFKTKFDLPSDTPIFGPYKGKLSNGGATVELYRPDPPQGPQHPDFRLVPFILTDRVKYSDKAPWPTTADGGGHSLQRRSSYEYGNDPINWMGNVPTAGKFNTPTGIEPPTIATQPVGKSVTAGSTTTFNVSARGGQLHYQWIFNETELPNETNTILRLVNLATNQSGSYQVVVTNVAGAATSAVAQLTVTQSKPDSIRPTVTITSPTGPTTTNEAVILNGLAKDNVGVNSVLYSVNGGSFNSATGSVTWAKWGTPAPLLFAPGTNKVRAYGVDQAGNYSLTNERNYFLSMRVPLTLSTTGLGKVTGATNQQLMELGRSFLLTTTPAPGYLFSNWIVLTNATLAYVSASPSLNYMMQSNLDVMANFVVNPFGPVAGKFNGLFYDTNGVDHGSSGFFTFTATDRGTYTASLLTGGRKLSAAGQLSLDGNASNTIPRTGTSPLAVAWSVALDGSDRITGTVSDGTWTAALEGDRAVFNSRTNPCTLAAKYTLMIPGTPGATLTPEGNSYGTATIDGNGVVSLKGYLSDKTSAAQKVTVSKNGEWPLYVPLYAGKGSLLSWVSLSPRDGDDLHGSLSWSKPASPTAKYYPSGFINSYMMTGSRYVAPVGATNRILALPEAIVIFNGGNLPQPYTNNVILGLNSKVTNASPDKLTLSFTLSSGLFKGSFTPGNVGKAVSINGAVLQKATNAAGFFLGTTQCGSVLLTAPPSP